jgi:hypothetical protein
MVINVDDGDMNADWIKTGHWDLPTDPKYFTQDQLEQLSKLPAWQAAPDNIKVALGHPEVTRESVTPNDPGTENS